MFLDWVDDPFYVSEDKAVRWVPDGLLVMSDNGTIVAFGNYSDMGAKYAAVPTTTYKVGCGFLIGSRTTKGGVGAGSARGGEGERIPLFERGAR